MQTEVSFSQILGLCILLILLIPGEELPREIEPASHDKFESFIDRSKYQNHSKIIITGNRNLEDNWTGSGTENNPYLIEGLHIRDSNSCVAVSDTTRYLLIRDCLLECTETSGSECIQFLRVSNFRIERCIIQGGYRGISIQNSQNSIFANNSVYDCGWGIYSISTSNCTMQGNRVFRNDRGAAIFDSASWIIKSNWIYRNYDKGLIIGSRTENCTICGNHIGWNRDSQQSTIEDNADDNGGVHWDDNESAGNYWSDYDGSGEYSLGGRANSVDRYPNQLVDDEPPIIEGPMDIYYEEGTEGHQIEWNATEAFPCICEILLNGVLIYSESWDGSSIIIDVDGLSKGIHNFTVVVTDIMSYKQDAVIVDVFTDIFGNLGSELLVLSCLFSVLSVVIVLLLFRKSD